MSADRSPQLLLLLVLASIAFSSGLATPKRQLVANPTYACSLRSTGQVDCWGSGYSYQAWLRRDRMYWSISSGDNLVCVLGYDGYVLCWGDWIFTYPSPAQSVVVGDAGICVRINDVAFRCQGQYLGNDVPAYYPMTQVAIGGRVACGILAGDQTQVHCWSTETSLPDWPPCGAAPDQNFYCLLPSADALVEIAVSDSMIVCGLETTGNLVCLPRFTFDIDLGAYIENPASVPAPLQPPSGAFLPGTLVTYGDDFCALRVNHTVACWGNSSYLAAAAGTPASETAFVQVVMGEGFACGLQPEGTPLCWGSASNGELSPPAGVAFTLLAASSGYACGMRDEGEATICWGAMAPVNISCPTACFRNGTLNATDCRCQCPSANMSCTCPLDACKNGGRVKNDGSCSCECNNYCPRDGCERLADCSCRCPVATQPKSPNLPVANSTELQKSWETYLIAGGGSTFPVRKLPGQNIAGAPECSTAMLLLRLADTAWWSGEASCADSGSLFVGANMAHLDINQRPLASVRFSGDQDGGWLYRIVSCETESNLLLVCPSNWLANTLHCPDRDCSQCLPRGREMNSSSPADYSTTCTRGPAPAQARKLRSVLVAGGYSGYHADPPQSGSSAWRVPLPPDVTCATRFLMFSSRRYQAEWVGGGMLMSWRENLIVQLGPDGSDGGYQYIYRGCDEATSSLLLEPQWNITSEHCPYLDCTACLASSPAGDCSPSHMVPHDLQVVPGPNNSVILSWLDDGAPSGTHYAVYLRSARSSIRYTTQSRTLQINIGSGLASVYADVVRVYCPATCPTGGCPSPNSLAAGQLVRSVEGSEGCEGGEVDCMGVCDGPALLNPCGVCVLPADYYHGDGYSVDCANTCGGSAYIGDCGVCVGGRSGLSPNALKDCQGVCYGNATVDECGVCRADGDNRPSARDCTGLCGGKAVVDECGQCVLGTTKREFNADMDCAGQCFGKRLPTDPACQCKREELDKCFVCGGDNSTCTGCDGVPNSGMVRDLCGVCGGDNTTCCFLSFPQATVVIRNFKAIALRTTLDAGETVLVQNLHESRAYTVTLERIDEAKGKTKRQRRVFPLLQPGNELRVELSRPGKYRLTTVESSTASTILTVRYNAKTTDACGNCIDTDRLDKASSLHMAAYEHCCSVMESDNVHAWFATTHYHDALALEAPATRVVQRSDSYRVAPTRHLLRLVKPQMVDTSVWHPTDQRLAVGDLVVLENRDLLDHVISITGPQPLPDVVLASGTVAVAGPLLTPGTYRVESQNNLINTTFTVEFAFACTVHAYEGPQVGGHHSAVVVGLALAGGLGLTALLLAVAVYLRTQKTADNSVALAAHT